MKKFFFTLVGFLSLGIITLSQPVERALSPFSNIHVFGNIKVEVMTSPLEKVEFRRTENISPDDITTEVIGETLTIKSKIDITEKIDVAIIVYAKTLNNIQLLAGADLRSDSVFNTSALEIKANSGSDCYLAINNESVDAVIGSGAMLFLKGKTASANLQASSGATINASALICLKADVKVSTGANITVQVTEILNAHASTKGYISYIGNPEKVNRKTSLGGEIVGESE